MSTCVFPGSAAREYNDRLGILPTRVKDVGRHCHCGGDVLPFRHARQHVEDQVAKIHAARGHHRP